MSSDLHSIAQGLDRLIAAQQRQAWDYVHSIIVILTLCVLIWYTVETYRLRRVGQHQIGDTEKLLREAQRQNEVSLMPILAVAAESGPGGDALRIVLVNVGSGPAFNISIDRIGWESRRLNIEYGSSVLRPGQANELLFQFEEGNSGTLLDARTLFRWIKTSRTPNPLSIVVGCHSVNSIAYTFTFRCTSHDGKPSISYEGAASVNGGAARMVSENAPSRLLPDPAI